jgi:hypothetical protein
MAVQLDLDAILAFTISLAKEVSETSLAVWLQSV